MTRSAVIFDFDGTITRPYLNFDTIRAEIGVVEGPILEALSDMDEDERRRAMSILDRHEQEAAHNGTLHDGAAETLARLRSMGFPVAILTRNARRWVEVVLERFGITVDAIRTREDKAIKPSPEPVLSILREVEADPRGSWMVGDHLFDIISGKEAGVQTVLLLCESLHSDDVIAEATELADHAIRSLPELIPLVTR